MITNNYGLLGGTLDSTRHIESAMARLCTQQEQDAYHFRAMHGPRLASGDAMVVAASPGRLQAESN